MKQFLIDGSILEGGGQILRNGVALAALLRRPIVIHKIRNGRHPPGLKNQHRVGLELAAKIASATLLNAQNGSTSIEFTPTAIDIEVPGYYKADSVTAGSVTLLLQVALPLLLFSPSPTPVPPSVLTLLGGTNATHAPQIDYTRHVFLPFLTTHFGLQTIDVNVVRRGYFPKGGGEVTVLVPPLLDGQRLRSFTLLERGKVKSIGGIAHYARLPTVVGADMVAGANRQLAKAGYKTGSREAREDDFDVPVDIECRREPNGVAAAGGSGIVLWAELEGGGYIGGSAVGRKGVEPEIVGEEAAKQLLKGLQSGGCVDEWLQDQIIIFMALAEGMSQVRCGKGELELHTRTAIWLAEQMTDAEFSVEEQSSGTIIRCKGIGYMAPAYSSTSPVLDELKDTNAPG